MECLPEFWLFITHDIFIIYACLTSTCPGVRALRVVSGLAITSGLMVDVSATSDDIFSQVK